MATRERAHLTLSTAELLREGRPRRLAGLLACGVAAATVAVLAYASVELVRANREQGKLLPGGLPEWISECVIPVCLGVMALRFAWSPFGWKGRFLALGAVALAFALGLIPSPAPLVWPVSLVILAGALLGAPVFVAMGGLALLFFFKDGTPVAAVTAEVYRLISSPTLPAIPLLTTAGFVPLVGARRGEGRRPFSWREAIRSTWGAKWELSLPIVVIVAFASGRMSIVEASAAACAYAIFIECVVARDLPWRQLPAVLVKVGALVGAASLGHRLA